MSRKIFQIIKLETWAKFIGNPNSHWYTYQSGKKRITYTAQKEQILKSKYLSSNLKKSTHMIKQLWKIEFPISRLFPTFSYNQNNLCFLVLLRICRNRHWISLTWVYFFIPKQTQTKTKRPKICFSLIFFHTFN